MNADRCELCLKPFSPTTDKGGYPSCKCYGWMQQFVIETWNRLQQSIRTIRGTAFIEGQKNGFEAGARKAGVYLKTFKEWSEGR